METLELTETVYDDFVGANTGVYQQLFRHFGHEWPTDPVELAHVTRELWIPQGKNGVGTGEFGDPTPAAYADNQALGALDLIAKTQLYHGYLPPATGHETIVYAAGRKFDGMVAAWEMEELVRVRCNVVLGVGAFGARDRKPFDGNDERLRYLVQRAGASDVPWITDEFASEAPFGNEGKLGVLSAYVHFGANRIAVPAAMPTFNGQEAEAVTVVINGLPYIITGAKKRDRGLTAVSRPTAGSAALEAADLVPFGSHPRLAVLGGRIHGPRVAADVMRRLRAKIPGATGWAVAAPADDIIDQDPLLAVRLGLHELALMAGNVKAVKAAAAAK